jgi:hypothetical protein
MILYKKKLNDTGLANFSQVWHKLWTIIEKEDDELRVGLEINYFRENITMIYRVIVLYIRVFVCI